MAEFARALEGDFDLIADFGQRSDLGVQQHATLAHLADAFGERFDQITIGSRQQARGQFDDRHFGPQLRVNAAHLQADVAAANHQHGFGNVDQVQCTGAVHHPVAANVECRGHGGDTAGGQDAMIKRQLTALGDRIVITLQLQGGRVDE